MNNYNIIITILSITLPLIGGGIGYLLKYRIDKKRELQSEVTKARREIYQEFVNLIIDIFSASKLEKKKGQPDFTLKNLYDFYKKYIMYASPEVINSFSDYFQYLYSTNSGNIEIDSKTNFRKLSKIMLAMRQDLGLSNKNLVQDGENLFRAFLTDFDQIMKNP